METIGDSSGCGYCELVGEVVEVHHLPGTSHSDLGKPHLAESTGVKLVGPK